MQEVILGGWVTGFTDSDMIAMTAVDAKGLVEYR